MIMPRYIQLFLSLCVIACAGTSAFALPPTSDDFDKIIVGGSQSYKPTDRAPVDHADGTTSISVARTQIILDQRGFSPGVIDGRDTPRFRQALATHNRKRPDERLIVGLNHVSATPLFDTYEITKNDLSGPFTPDIPPLYVDQADRKSVV